MSNGADERQQDGVPGIVKGVALLPAVAPLAVALLASLAVLVFASEFRGVAVPTFPMVVGLLTGQEVGLGISAWMLGHIQVQAVAAPFGIVLVTVLALTRLSFTRGWLEISAVRRPMMLRGAAAMLAVALFGKLVAGFAGYDAEYGSVAITYGLRLLTPVLAGAVVWPAAVYVARNRVAERLVLGFAGLLGLLVVLVTGMAVVEADGGMKAVVLLAAPLLLAFWGLNIVSALAQWPFGGLIEGGFGSFTETLSLPSLASNVGWLWLLPLVVAATFVALGYLYAPADDWTELLTRGKQFLLAALVVALPLSLLGGVRLSGDLSVFGSGGTDHIVVGLAGMPWRLVLPVAVWTLLFLLGGWLAGRLAGREWADNDQLPHAMSAATAMAVAAVEPLKGAARRAQQTAAASGPSAVPPFDDQEARARADAGPAAPAPTQDGIRRLAEQLGVAEQLAELGREAGIATDADLHDDAKMRRMETLVRGARAPVVNEPPAPAPFEQG